MLYWISVNYEITEDEDFETVKTRVISDFESYLKLLNGKFEESLKKVSRKLLSLLPLVNSLEKNYVMVKT